MLIATGIVYVLLGDLAEALALIAAIGLVVGISFYQAQKTEHALEALRDLVPIAGVSMIPVLLGGPNKRITAATRGPEAG